MDETLKAVLRYVKIEDHGYSWQRLRDSVFAALYHPDMTFLDVFQVLMHAYERAILEPRFELPGRHHAADDLILSPIKGFFSIDPVFSATSLETRYSVEQFYGAMIKHMLSNLRLTRIDWCREELGLPSPAVALPG